MPHITPYNYFRLSLAESSSRLRFLTISVPWRQVAGGTTIPGVPRSTDKPDICQKGLASRFSGSDLQTVTTRFCRDTGPPLRRFLFLGACFPNKLRKRSGANQAPRIGPASRDVRDSSRVLTK